MANSCCYTLVIRQVTCQNGVRKESNNAYTNIDDNTVIQLAFGYTLTVQSRTNSHVMVKLENSNYIPALIFSIPSNSYKEFNVPKESGTLIIYIGVKKVTCQSTQCCSQQS